MAIKTAHDGKTKYKARLVVQGHADKEKTMLVHSSTTLWQWSVRVRTSVAAILSLKVWSQDI